VRPPDFVIGSPENPYLLRWWIIPRNRWFNIYLHQIRRSDDDRALHDHPWWNISIVLKGGYEEVTPCFLEGCKGTDTRWRGPGSVIFRRATAAHRLVIPARDGAQRFCWSLFITGRRVREWGFHCPHGWRDWRVFTAPADRGQIGRGCE
jgi:hypothetical protein